jgi:exopolyphosphatase/guanosine-5'-triphosphate,3'-diphosphate pyrophosphatase
VIFERTSRFGFKIIHESKSRVRIGEGAYHKAGVLQDEPMERALLALKSFKSIITAFKARKVLAVATSALRDAPNQKIFINRVSRELNINIKVIDGETEALLGGIAAANLLKFNSGVTIDIGGGSTEFALIENRKVINRVSLNLGTVRLKELFSNDKDLSEAKDYIRKELSKIPLELRRERIITIGGTLRALSKVIIEENNYPLNRMHGFEYSYLEEKRLIEKIIFMSRAELLKIGFKRERVDVIQWGLLIFQEVSQLFGIQEVVTSGAGIREGIFLKDILRSYRGRFPDNFNPSLRNILDDFQIRSDKVFKNSVKVTNRLFETLQKPLNIREEYRELLIYATKLTEIGVKVDFYGSTKNGFHMILNRFVYGVTHKDSLIVGSLVRFSNKNSLSDKLFREFGELLPTQRELSQLHSIIYLSKILTSNYSSAIEFELKFSNHILTLEIFDEALFYTVSEKLDVIELFEVELKKLF